VSQVIYHCSLADGTGTAGLHLTPWFQAWAASTKLRLEPGTLNLCADRDVVPPATDISLRPWDAALALQFRKAQQGYDPRLYPILLRRTQRAWLFRWADLASLAAFVGDTQACSHHRRCEIIAEANLTKLWSLGPGSSLEMQFS
jgi:hypothetical protein